MIDVGEVVHIGGSGYWCLGATVAAPRRRGLDLFQRQERGIVVLEAIPYGRRDETGTWHRPHPIPDRCPRLGPPRGHYRMRR